jgi:hypothetical protein
VPGEKYEIEQNSKTTMKKYYVPDGCCSSSSNNSSIVFCIRAHPKNQISLLLFYMQERIMEQTSIWSKKNCTFRGQKGKKKAWL